MSYSEMLQKNIKNLLLISSLVVITPAVMATPITITSNNIGAAASDGVTRVVDSYTGTSIPTSTVISATSGLASSVNQITYTGDDNNASLSVGMTHIINNSGGLSGYSMAYDNTLKFTAKTSTSYSLDAFYNIAGSNTDATLYVNLFDITANTSLALDFMNTQVISNETLLIGSGTGSVSGNIIAGHEYAFFFAAYIGDINGSTVGASATAVGGVTLNFGALNTTGLAVVNVAEPEMLALLSIGFLVIGAGMRAKKYNK